MERKYERITKKHRYYKKGESEKYLGHTFTFVMDYVENGKLKTDVIVLTEKDIFMAALNKARYFANKENV